MKSPELLLELSSQLPDCLPYDQFPFNAYGYQPSLAAGITFLALFSFSSITHLAQAIAYKRWWLGFFVIGAACEALGWLARTVASHCSFSMKWFLMQIALLVFAPVWTMAGVYIVLFYLIPMFGRRRSPRWMKVYLCFCFCADIVSLTLQGTGGGIAGSAFTSGKDTIHGTHIIVAGILFQLASTVAFAILMVLVFVQGRYAMQCNRQLRNMSIAMSIAVACMIARNVYRSIELLQGWDGDLNTNEAYILGLDGAIMFLAAFAFNVCNPGRLLKKSTAQPKKHLAPSSDESSITCSDPRKEKLNGRVEVSIPTNSSDTSLMR